MAAADSPQPSFLASRNMRTAWLVVALLLPVALLNYLDRQMLASMKFSVMEDIPSIGNDANWGKMLAQFKWVYAILSPIGGYLADRFSRKYTVVFSLIFWSGVTWWTGHVTTYSELITARTLMGVSEAFYIPAGLALIADYHSGHTRSRAVGLHMIAIYFGVVAGGFSGYVADAPSLGWRFAFDACGVFGILYAIPLLLFLRDAPRLAGTADAETIPATSAVWQLVSNASYILLVLYFALPALAGWVVRDWMPAILKEQYNIKQGPAGVFATTYNITAVMGVFLGAWLSDTWIRRNVRGRIYVSAIGMALIVPAIFGMGNAPTLAIAVAFLVLFGLGWGFFDCSNMPILCQIVKPRLRATGYGLMNTISISCGGLADWWFGILRDRQTPTGLIFGAFAGFAVLSVVFVLLIRPRRELTAVEQAT